MPSRENCSRGNTVNFLYKSCKKEFTRLHCIIIMVGCIGGGGVLIYVSVRGGAVEQAIIFRIPTPGDGLIFIYSVT